LEFLPHLTSQARVKRPGGEETELSSRSKKLKFAPAESEPSPLPSTLSSPTPTTGQEYSECVLSALISLLGDKSLPDCDNAALQNSLQLLQLRLRIAGPPAGYHHCFEFLVTPADSGSDEIFDSKSLLISAADRASSLQCKLTLVESLDGCLRIVENKQLRFRKRFERKKPLPTDGEKKETRVVELPNRRSRRKDLQSEAQCCPNERSTAAISHFFVISLRQRESINGHYKIFLGEALHSNLVLIGKPGPLVLSDLLSQILSLPSRTQTPTALCTTVSVLGSIQFITKPSLDQVSCSSVILEDFVFEVAVGQLGRVPYIISARGLGCDLRLLRCQIFGREGSAPCRSKVNLIEIADGCQGHISESVFSGSLSHNEVFCQSIITCSCKSTLAISNSRLSDSEQSLVHLLSSSSLTLDSCHCLRSRKSGVHLSDPSHVVISNSEVEDNRKCGVEIFSTCLATRHLITLRDCRIHSNTQSGILVYNSCCSVSSCLVSSNGWANLSCQQGASLTLLNSTLTKSTRSGIHASGADTRIRMLRGNTVTDNKEGDIACSDGACIAED
jgi:parallel beta-helix repeat protein